MAVGKVSDADFESEVLKATAPVVVDFWAEWCGPCRAIASALADLEERVSRPLVLIVGMLTSKDSAGFLKNFAGLARRVVAVPVPQQENAVPAAALAERARAVGIPAQESCDLQSALSAIGTFDLDPPPRILVTGSLYLAGAVLAANGTPPE